MKAEGWLLLLAVALYAYDSLLLLSSNEAVLVRGWRGRWLAGFGAHRWKLAGKEPLLPNLFTPHRPLFRLAWRFEGERDTEGQTQTLQAPRALDTFGAFVLGSLICLFMLLPIGLFGAGLAFTSGAVALLYANNLIALALVFRRRHALHLTTRQFGMLAFECLVCPPFSINLVRKLCGHIPIDESFTVAARRCLRRDDLAEAHVQCLIRLEEQVDAAAEHSERMQLLLAAKARFAPVEDA